jgi:hypothetical protein
VLCQAREELRTLTMAGRTEKGVQVLANVPVRPILLKNSLTIVLARFSGVALPLTDARERLVGRSERPIFLRAIQKRRDAAPRKFTCTQN